MSIYKLENKTKQEFKCDCGKKPTLISLLYGTECICLYCSLPDWKQKIEDKRLR